MCQKKSSAKACFPLDSSVIYHFFTLCEEHELCIWLEENTEPTQLNCKEN